MANVNYSDIIRITAGTNYINLKNGNQYITQYIYNSAITENHVVIDTTFETNITATVNSGLSGNPNSIYEITITTSTVYWQTYSGYIKIYTSGGSTDEDQTVPPMTLYLGIPDNT